MLESGNVDINAGQVRRLAKAFVEEQRPKIPGFIGAHLMGSLNHMPPEAPFPAFKDVDMNIVLSEGQGVGPQDVFYEGLIFEYGRLNVARYHSPEVVLADPDLADNLAVDSILSDPSGMLGELHAGVKRGYAQRRWVLARCEVEKETAQQGLVGIETAGSMLEIVTALLGNLSIGLSGLIAVANLTPPTHRRSLVLLKDLFTAHGRMDLHERLLALLGFAHLDEARVAGYLKGAAKAFDYAVQVTSTPLPLSFKLKPHVRPYMVAGSQEMIDEGCPREAMLWIVACLAIAVSTILVDAPEPEQLVYQASFARLLTEIGWDSLEAARARLPEARALSADFFQAADEIVARHPGIEG